MTGKDRPSTESSRALPGDEKAPSSLQSLEGICPACAGTGKLGRGTCPDCDGSGVITVVVGDDDLP